MAKLQLLVEDSVSDILDKLARRSDKTIFVEIAIKKAYQNKAIRELFNWSEDKPQIKKSKPEPSSTPNKKVKFDDDFK